ncbi:MAG: UDP-N-acetylmuramoyl-tripeptide--D-alanyl-D-alanine ligase [Treponema sp.]|nr:UDP-N-acetylmuramoyl-tripeptide--D-alanyl-D-alanine ligase [Treponema sp.]MCL2250988.1 UDP-N-acetylmuramoyl-tripeptide--D-alanyl-D-alanine ligase [Treponema sp.]
MNTEYKQSLQTSFAQLMSLDELSNLLGGRLISFSSDNGFSSVSIDSRSACANSVFYALNGTMCDGHKFVNAAFSAGASCAVVESSKINTFNIVNIAQNMGKNLIVVEDTLASLQDSARVYLEKFDKLKKVGITGSAGKTMTKEITAAIISCEKNTVMNKGNLNSETGLPLSVFEVRDHHEVGVFELGMNKTGEILKSANVLKPNIALITNIGSAHIEFFGSKDKILDEKISIFNYLKKDDIALIPSKDEYAKKMAKAACTSGNIKFYSTETIEEFEGTRSLGLNGTQIYFAGEKINFSLPGKHSLDDAIAAIAIAKEIPVSISAIKQGLESVKPLFGRLQVLKGRTTVICDCYNANPESTAKAIEFCDSAEWKGRKIYVIADMLELGEFAHNAHSELGSLLDASKADKIFLFGKEIKAAVNILKNKPYFYSENFDEVSASLNSYVQKDDIVLLKGSRGCALERLTDMLLGAVNVQ